MSLLPINSKIINKKFPLIHLFLRITQISCTHLQKNPANFSHHKSKTFFSVFTSFNRLSEIFCPCEPILAFVKLFSSGDANRNLLAFKFARNTTGDIFLILWKAEQRERELRQQHAPQAPVW